MKTKITKLLSELKSGLYERDETINISFLSALAGENIFLYGPPGVAKSLISRRIASAFESENYFEYLMQKFSTPEEVFGPVSLSELKKDNYTRKTKGYLPEAEFGFLDEIWKSNPAILNTLLTIINEKKFKNGNEIVNVPLKVLFSASNETPPPKQGLEALYDRFLVRVSVKPLEKWYHFEDMLQNGSIASEVEMSEKITTDEWNSFKENIQKVKISKDTFNIIKAVKLEIENLNGSNDDKIYISDRRWQKVGYLLKASAFFCNREETNIVDCFLMSYCLWDKESNQEEIDKIVTNAIRNLGIDSGVDLEQLQNDKNRLEEEIKNELFYDRDVYETVIENNKKYIEVQLSDFQEKHKDLANHNIDHTIYLPFEKIGTKDEFNPMDADDDKLEWIKCNFNGSNKCEIIINYEGFKLPSYIAKSNYWNWKDDLAVRIEFIPNILHKKGDRKSNIHTRLIEAFKQDLIELGNSLKTAIETATKKQKEFIETASTPFISEEKVLFATTTIQNQVEEIELMIKDIQSLINLLKQDTTKVQDDEHTENFDD